MPNCETPFIYAQILLMKVNSLAESQKSHKTPQKYSYLKQWKWGSQYDNVQVDYYVQINPERFIVNIP